MTLTIERPATAAPAKPKTSPKEVLKLAKDQQVKIVDLRFVDMPGIRKTIADCGFFRSKLAGAAGGPEGRGHGR